MASKTLNLSANVEKKFTLKTSPFVKEGTIMINKKDARLVFAILKENDNKSYYKKQTKEDEQEVMGDDYV